jgi:hypothetical protein
VLAVRWFARGCASVELAKQETAADQPAFVAMGRRDEVGLRCLHPQTQFSEVAHVTPAMTCHHLSPEPLLIQLNHGTPILARVMSYGPDSTEFTLVLHPSPGMPRPIMLTLAHVELASLPGGRRWPGNASFRWDQQSTTRPSRSPHHSDPLHDY